MAYETRVTVFPDIAVQPDGRGGFPPTSFGDLVGREVTMPGLDPSWVHTVTAARVAADRNTAELTFHSAPLIPKQLDRGLRIVTWLPPAHIKAHDPDGNELAVAKLDAPLQVGEWVEVAGVRHRVTGPLTHTEMWPHRDPDTGTCHEGLDYQHVTLTSDPEPAHLPTTARE